MVKFYVAGGAHHEDSLSRQEWGRSEYGLLLAVDINSGEVDKIIEYKTPSELICAEEGVGTSFTAGELHNNLLYLPTEWEILTIDVSSLEVVASLSRRFFNDVHAVTFRNNNFVVTSTGLDAVFEISEDGMAINEWYTRENGRLWDDFDSTIDYRKVPSTKPHVMHPNFSTVIEGDVWVTRFHAKDSICVSDPSKGRILLDVERPHDGHYNSGFIYYTTVNGHVLVVDYEKKKVIEDFDVSAAMQSNKLAGWCRGFAAYEEFYVLGFSRIRPTKFSSNLSWLKNIKHTVAATLSEPTRLAIFDAKRKKLIREIDLEFYGMNAIFSIIKA